MSVELNNTVYLPHTAEIVSRIQNAPDIFTLGLKFDDQHIHHNYSFSPGQFNMLYLYGVGEVAISIVSDPKEIQTFHHTIRSVGRVTKAIAQLKVGDQLGVRGPFGQGWPIDAAKNKDILIITGGLGCAPSVSIVNYIEKRRDQFGRLIILQGVKHSHDLLFQEQYQHWANLPDTEVLISADTSQVDWPWHTGQVTELLKNININPDNTICMMCGPEGMLLAVTAHLLSLKISEHNIYLSLERNMECAVGHCGHCQFGGEFVCKDGPVFCYSKVKQLLGKKGF